MNMKAIAALAFFINTTLIGSYYAIAKEVLDRVDPIVFTFLVMMTLAPPGLLILLLSAKSITRDAVKGGFILGSCLCLGLFTLSVALKHNTATGTAFFPSLNGLLAALFTWLFLRQPISKVTWFAGLVSVVGACLLMFNSSMGGARGTMIAFVGGLFCTGYIFLADREQKDPQAQWALFGVELLTMSLWACLIVLLFGDWQKVHLDMPKDLGVILYVGLATTLLPTLVTLLFQKYISPVTVSFIYVLEPIMGAIVARLYLGEELSLDSYLGGALVVAGALINTWGMGSKPSQKPALRVRLASLAERWQLSAIGSVVYPLFCCILGAVVAYRLGGFPPIAWFELIKHWSQIPAMMQQPGQPRFEAVFLVVQSLTWLIAWTALFSMGILATYRAYEKFFLMPKPVKVDVRALRQLGYTPYTPSVSSVREDKPLVQRRRLNRRIRLVRDNPPIDPAWLVPLEPGQEEPKDQQQQNANSRYWMGWDDMAISEVHER